MYAAVLGFDASWDIRENVHSIYYEENRFTSSMKADSPL